MAFSPSSLPSPSSPPSSAGGRRATDTVLGAFVSAGFPSPPFAVGADVLSLPSAPPEPPAGPPEEDMVGVKRVDDEDGKAMSLKQTQCRGANYGDSIGTVAPLFVILFGVKNALKKGG